jgi:hypothetical protein
MPLEPGDQLGPYKIQALLGVGGFGEVYRGRDMRLGREVALKVISPRLVGDAILRQRFELEARAASALNHPSIVTVYDVGETSGMSWISNPKTSCSRPTGEEVAKHDSGFQVIRVAAECLLHQRDGSFRATADGEENRHRMVLRSKEEPRVTAERLELAVGRRPVPFVDKQPGGEHGARPHVARVELESFACLLFREQITGT